MIITARFAALALLTAGLASAATITFTGVNTTLGVGTVNGGSLWINQDGANFNAYFIGGMNATADGFPRVLFCLDMFTDIYIGSVNSSTLTNPDSLPVQRAAWLLTSEYADLTAPHVDATSGELGAALQIAIWDIVHDGGDGLTAGRIQQSTDVLNPTTAVVALYVQMFINSSNGQSSTNAFVYNNVCIGGVPAQYCGVPSQTLIGLAVNDGGPVVPEPASIGLAGAGLGLVALLGRKRAERASSR